MSKLLAFVLLAGMFTFAAGGEHDKPSRNYQIEMHSGVQMGGDHKHMKDQVVEDAVHKDDHSSNVGKAGNPANVSRTIDVSLSDTMRFNPDNVTVKAGETVRFLVINEGRLPHEMVVGSVDELEEHAKMMRKMPGMAHEEPNMVRLAPGQRGGIVWEFAQPGIVDFACLVPGHMEAGMVGKVRVE